MLEEDRICSTGSLNKVEPKTLRLPQRQPSTCLYANAGTKVHTWSESLLLVYVGSTRSSGIHQESWKYCRANTLPLSMFSAARRSPERSKRNWPETPLPKGVISVNVSDRRGTSGKAFPVREAKSNRDFQDWGTETAVCNPLSALE
jgi:hypothetical protein